ncbi:MAG: caspase family protein [Cyanobacteria bacterium P01_A01_bin.84]
MTRNLYALLVGIDEYPEPVNSLAGCVNDIKAIKEYLHKQLANSYKLGIKTLFNREATRENIIQGFRKYLSQANSNDVVLFYYSGHGAQEQAPKEFWHLEPDRLDETLVCYNSRSEGGWDLADKELAKLIAEVSENNPHILVVLDCCHSGSGTKDPVIATGERRAPVDKRERPLDSFIFSLSELKQLVNSDNLEDDSEHPTGWNLPKGRHILLGACRDTEKAKEYIINGEKRGAFSYSLLNTLQNTNGKLTYRDLFERSNSLFRNQFKGQSSQSPQFEVTHLGDELQYFLDGAIAKRIPYFLVKHHKKLGWVIDGGAIHGVQPPSGNETTVLAVFPFDSSSEDLRQSSKSIGEAEVTQVLPHQSVVKINCQDLDNKDFFKAIITSLPLPPVGVYIDGEKTGADLVRQAMQSFGGNNKSSAYVREQKQNNSQLKLLCHNHKYQIFRSSDNRSIVPEINDYTDDNAYQVIEYLEHIARWISVNSLKNYKASQIQTGDVEMKLLFADDNVDQSSQIRLEYKKQDGKWQAPAFRLKLTNKSEKTLYCALLNLTDRFAVSAPFFTTGSVRLEPKQEAFALDGEFLELEVPDELYQRNINECFDIIKLIVSTAEFDARLITQEKLDEPQPNTRNLPSPCQSTLERLMNRVQCRDIQPTSQGKINDWYTEQIEIVTIRF